MRLGVLFIVLSLCFISLLAKQNTAIKEPPPSLKQWYKPDNKHNVFQHNMFKLRRELQALNEYKEKKDLVHTQKWAGMFVTHYKKIADMVPEWEGELRFERIEQLDAAAKEGDFNTLGKAIRKIQRSCTNCHKTFRAQVATIYRSPDFSKTHVQFDGDSLNYRDFMKILMKDVNRIKIAATDGDKGRAQLALTNVRKGVFSLRASCDTCHKGDKAKNYYLGEDTTALMDKLEAAIEKGKSGRALGEFAVQACAGCHGSHRILYDLKREIVD